MKIYNDTFRIRIDAHCDSVLTIEKIGESLSVKNKRRQLDFPRINDSKINVQFFSLFLEPEYKPNFSLQRTLELLDLLCREVSIYKDIELITTKKDLIYILQQNKSGVIASIEDGDAVKSLAILRILYKLGIRSIGLSWNNSNQIACGVNEESNRGLTNFGVEVVKEMNRLGMLIDISHLNERSFWDVLKCSTKPLIASHSNCYSICNHKRNLKDAQIIELAKNRGVMCIAFETSFLGYNTIKGVIEHIKYVCDLVGVNHTGIGSDFDGLYNSPLGLESVEEWNSIEILLEKEGFSDEDISKIMGGNICRLLCEVI